jgi:hypothetical protein
MASDSCMVLQLTTINNAAHAQGTFNIELGAITPPTKCTASYWSINFQRKVTYLGGVKTPPTRYLVQYLNDDLNLVHYWGSGYDQYVQNYGLFNYYDLSARIIGGYVVPLWTDTYRAVTIEYALVGDHVVWETRASITCEHGTVTDYQLTSRAADSQRSELPRAESE